MAESVYFVTGFPGYIGRRLVPALLAREPDCRVYALVQPRFETRARAELDKWDPAAAARTKLLAGDVVDMHLGLSSGEYSTLAREVTDIFHLAALYQLGAERRTLRQVNVDGTRSALELAADCRGLRRFNHMSTAVVAGTREGVVEENELEEGQKFRTPYEESKYEAEKLVRAAMETLPITVYRPSIVVGDSRTGEIDRFDGPYYLAILLVLSPVSVPLPLPGSAVAPLNVVPVDFVVDAMLSIAADPRAVGRTFHLVDPNPMSARKVYEYIAGRSGKRLPPISVSYRFADRLMGIPILERLVREERAAVASVNQLIIYNCNNTLELLDGSGIRCPRLETYLDKLIDYVQRYYKERRSEGEPEDPLRA